MHKWICLGNVCNAQMQSTFPAYLMLCAKKQKELVSDGGVLILKRDVARWWIIGVCVWDCESNKICMEKEECAGK